MHINVLYTIDNAYFVWQYLLITRLAPLLKIKIYSFHCSRNDGMEFMVDEDINGSCFHTAYI